MDPRRKGPGEDDVAGESIVLERCGGNKEGGMEKTFMYMITEKFHKQKFNITITPHKPQTSGNIDMRVMPAMFITAICAQWRQ